MMNEFAQSALDFIKNETQFFNSEQFHEAEIKALQYLSYLEWIKEQAEIPENWPNNLQLIEGGIINSLERIAKDGLFNFETTFHKKQFFAVLKPEFIKNPHLVEEAVELGLNGFIYTATPNAAYNQHLEQMLLRVAEDTHLEVLQVADCRSRGVYVEGLAPLNYQEFAQKNEPQIIHFKKQSPANLSLEPNVISYLGDVKHLLPGTKIMFNDSLGKERKCKVLSVDESGFSIQVKKQTTLSGNTTLRFVSDNDVFLDEIILGDIKQPLSSLKLFQNDGLELVSEITNHNQILVPISDWSSIIIGSKIFGGTWNGEITAVLEDKISVKINSSKAQIALFDRISIEGYQPENKIKIPADANLLITNNPINENSLFQLETIDNELLSKKIVNCKKLGFFGIILPSGISSSILQNVLLLAKAIDLKSFVNISYRETKNRFHCLAISSATGIILEELKKLDAQLERLEL